MAAAAPVARQRGETLVGLLVGVALGLALVAGGAQFMAHLLQSHSAVLQTTRLQQDMHFAMDRMADAVRDAQYSASAAHTRHPQACTDAWCEAAHFQVTPDALTFSADRNHNGSLDSNECMGFRVRAGVLSMRTGCHAGGWQPMTDVGSVMVSQLQVHTRCQRLAHGLRRQVVLRLQAQAPPSAQPPHDSPSSQWQRTVTLRNDLPLSVQAVFCP